jgi:hypothetical protein
MRFIEVPEKFKEVFKFIVLNKDNGFNWSDRNTGIGLSKRVGEKDGQLIIFEFIEQEEGDYLYHTYNPVTKHKYRRNCKTFGEVIDNLLMDIEILA